MRLAYLIQTVEQLISDMLGTRGTVPCCGKTVSLDEVRQANWACPRCGYNKGEFAAQRGSYEAIASQLCSMRMHLHVFGDAEVPAEVIGVSGLKTNSR